MMRRRALFWLILPVLTMLLWLAAPLEEAWALPLLALMWAVTLASLLPPAAPLFAVPLRWLRQRPALYWLLVLVYLAGALSLWLVPYQPTNGRLLTPAEYMLLLAFLWFLLWLLVYDLDSSRVRAMGLRLSQSRFSGLLLTLTTLLLLFIAAEFWLRLFYITTDSYGFTAMNYHWYKNFYWGHYNSLGYRDYEPQPDRERLTRVAVVGDSFAMGHGLNNIDDSFPQMLEKRLGDTYDVNLIAQSGWDSDIELHYLAQYPLEPDIVILSYYLNDIDHLLADPSQHPDAAFDFPQDPALSWFVLNYFLPNYIYYNLMQFTSPARAADFTSRLIDAHMNDELWAQQAWWLNEMVEWTNARQMRLIALVWPHLLAVSDSAPVTVRVRDFFLERGVEVVDMTPVLIDRDPRQMILNRFDAHPGIEAQKLAAEALYQAIEHGQRAEAR